MTVRRGLSGVNRDDFPSGLPGPRTPEPRLREVTGSGFVPGEDVAVCIILRSASSDADGRARALVDEREIPPASEGVVLFGYISGTLVYDGRRRL